MAEYAHYHIGDLIYTSAEFRDTANALKDPTTVYFIYSRVSNNVTASAVTAQYPGDGSRIATGQYSYHVTATAAGDWRYIWAGSGAVIGAGSGRFIISPQQI